jgi:hypothetical protein
MDIDSCRDVDVVPKQRSEIGTFRMVVALTLNEVVALVPNQSLTAG